MNEAFSEEQLRVLERLKQGFDRLYEAYGTAIQQGANCRMLFPDTPAGRLTGEQWQEYLRQRSAYEGWTFHQSQLELKFVPETDMPARAGEEIHLLNPYRKSEAGYRKLGSNLYQILSAEERQSHRDRFARTWEQH